MKIEVKNCKKCPFVDLNYYNDWHRDVPVRFCQLAKKILKNVEEIPDWCPIRKEIVEVFIKEKK